MNFIVKYNNMVVLGIIPWNNKYIMDVMRARYDVEIEIPKIEPEASQFPLVLNDSVTIYPAEENRLNSINPMIEYYYGPTWEFLENKVIAHYEVRPLDLDSVKGNYKAKAAFLRYKKEISGTKVVINDIEYALETDRESKTKYIHKLVSIEENANINWKFSNQWVVLTKQNLQQIVNAIDSHIQSTFDEEYNFNIQIDAAQNVQELLNIEGLNRAEDVFPN
jgi:hypothetical protein